MYSDLVCRWLGIIYCLVVIFCKYGICIFSCVGFNGIYLWLRGREILFWKEKIDWLSLLVCVYLLIMIVFVVLMLFMRCYLIYNIYGDLEYKF